MFLVLASAVDVLHALLMVAWVLGLPLLFWHRYPRLTRGYAIYALSFIILSQVSHYALGECFLTTLSRALWLAGSPDPGAVAGEWFTVRLAYAVFRLSPSHRSIVYVSEALILLTAVGMLISMRRLRGHACPPEAGAGGMRAGGLSG